MHAADLALVAALWDAQFVRWVVWVGLVVLTVALLVLIRTRWGQQQALGKCVVLSLLAHLLLAIYMTTVNIVTSTINSPEGGGVHVAIVAGPEDQIPRDSSDSDQWAAVSGETADPPIDLAPLPADAQAPPLEPVAEPQPQAAVSSPAPNKLPDAPPSEEAAPPELVAVTEPVVRPAPQKLEAVDMPQPETADSPDLVPPPEDAPQPPQPTGEAANPAAASAKPLDAQGWQAGKSSAVPKVFQGRIGDHLPAGGQTGATKQTESAVAAALRWLAANQTSSGRWNARNLGGGTGLAEDGQDRQGAGATADTGLTGLALLAFLASGHTHLEGPYRDTVRRGLEFLLGSQDAAGSLAATTNQYERMYCHAMATCALSEAYAMTGDRRLMPAVRKAIAYSVNTQDRASGGWRYQFGQIGDTSQLGWQVMALKSAELGGIAMPATTRGGIERFLRSVTLGAHGGLACYQPANAAPARPAVATRSMTAEALVCRQFLGRLDRPETLAEATSYILQEPPGSGVVNHYYWYYATLALYQTQGDAWRRWNEALQKQLLATQRLDGSSAGSWDPDPVWGRCGGRVYSTSLCALCLEVYYRFLPLYVEAAGREPPVP
jgi:hypothetical protein